MRVSVGIFLLCFSVKQREVKRLRVNVASPETDKRQVASGPLSTSIEATAAALTIRAGEARARCPSSTASTSARTSASSST